MGEYFRKFKKQFKQNVDPDTLIYKLADVTYHHLSAKKWEYNQNKNIAKENAKIASTKSKKKSIQKSCNIISNAKSKDIVLYNPLWLGVANSTKGLFENIVPTIELQGRKNRKKVANAIIANENIEMVIFSQMCEGWDLLIQEIHEKRPDLKIKVIWHANNYETISDFTWGLNKKVISMYNDGLIDAFGFVKKTMAEFYKNRGYNAYYFSNTVKKDYSENNNEIEKNIGEKENNNNGESGIRVGVYNAHSREIKNVYTQILSTVFFEKAFLDIVPSSDDIEKYLDEMNISYTDLKSFIPTDELMKRISKNDINIYVTFTECAPMFPMESFKNGVPCLIGNNNDYFIGSKLRDYVCVNREDDPREIYMKMKNVLENKEEVMELYTKWKENFDRENQKRVDDFINA